MRVVPLAAIPNQSLSVRLDDVRMVLRIKDANGVMVADLERAGATVLSAVRVLAGEPVIPYRYLETGNFIFLTLNDDLPDWRKFNVSQQLLYLTAAEIATLRANPPTFGDLVDQGNYVMQYLTDDAGFYLTEDNGDLLIQG